VSNVLIVLSGVEIDNWATPPRAANKRKEVIAASVARGEIEHRRLGFPSDCGEAVGFSDSRSFRLICSKLSRKGSIARKSREELRAVGLDRGGMFQFAFESFYAWLL
jgi:hypothetical protein